MSKRKKKTETLNPLRDELVDMYTGHTSRRSWMDVYEEKYPEAYELVRQAADDFILGRLPNYSRNRLLGGVQRILAKRGLPPLPIKYPSWRNFIIKRMEALGYDEAGRKTTGK